MREHAQHDQIEKDQSMNNQPAKSQGSHPREPFTLIAYLLDLSLDALPIPERCEEGTFSLELDNASGLCTIDFSDFRICLQDSHYTGTWKVRHVLPMCPLCPDWDDRYPIGNDFFGEPCMINGVACCETCYSVYMLTSEVKA